MDDLTKKGLGYIKANQERLSEWAKNVFEGWTAKGMLEDDHWFMFDTVKFSMVGDYSTSEFDMIDINIWKSDEYNEGTDIGEWHATAYPMQVNSVGKIQTNCQEFIRLW